MNTGLISSLHTVHHFVGSFSCEPIKVSNLTVATGCFALLGSRRIQQPGWHKIGKKEPHNDPGSSMDTKTIPVEPKDRALLSQNTVRLYMPLDHAWNQNSVRVCLTSTPEPETRAGLEKSTRPFAMASALCCRTSRNFDCFQC